MLNESDLHPYQKSTVQHIIDHLAAGLFLAMGLGKTVSTLTAIKRLMFDELEIDKVLVIAPKRVAEYVWAAEVGKWAHLEGVKIATVVGNERQRKAALREEADIYTLGRDNVAWLCGQYGGNMLPFDMLVIDESSSFKNANSVRFKALRRTQPSFNRVVILTGTPAPNSLEELWPQLFMLDRGERLGRTLGEYRRNYFTINTYQPHAKHELIDGREATIHKAISDICISMKSKDYLDLPGRIDNYIDVPFNEALRKKYGDFERDSVLELFENLHGDDEITAVNAAALSTKLLQFANGAVYDQDRNVHHMHDLKLDALDEIIEASQGRPVLVARTYKHDRDRIHQRFKRLCPRELKTNHDIDDWNAGKVPLMTMHPASGGHGLNLQSGGNTIVWFGQTWSLELYQQFNARLDRQGKTEVTIINHLLAEGTIDHRVIESLAQKNKGQEGLLSAVKAIVSKYLK